MALPCSTGIVGLQIGNVQSGINNLHDVVKNGERHLAQGNEAAQTLMGLEQCQKANLCNRAFRRTEREKAFLGRGYVHLGQIFGGQDSLEPRIRGSLDGGHIGKKSLSGKAFGEAHQFLLRYNCRSN